MWPEGEIVQNFAAYRNEKMCTSIKIAQVGKKIPNTKLIYKSVEILPNLATLFANSCSFIHFDQCDQIGRISKFIG